MTPTLLLWRRRDPETSAEPRVQELVRALRAMPVDRAAAAPTDEFRSQLRAQLVAVAPTVIAEAAAESGPGGGAGARRPARRRSLAHAALLAGAACCALVLLAGVLVGLSGRALPGDALYGIKRATEGVRLSLANGDTSAARRYLVMAQTRVGEARDLLGRATSMVLGGSPVHGDSRVEAGGGVSVRTEHLVETALTDADSDTRHASWLLTERAVKHHDPAALDVMTAWAPLQAERLAGVVDRLPAGQVRTHAAASLTLVQQAQTRSTALLTSLDEPCISSSRSDLLGPLACQGAGGTGGAVPSSPTGSATATGTSTTSGAPSTPAAPTTGAPAPGTSTGGGSESDQPPASDGGTDDPAQPGSSDAPPATQDPAYPETPGDTGSGGDPTAPLLPSYPIPTALPSTDGPQESTVPSDPAAGNPTGSDSTAGDPTASDTAPTDSTPTDSTPSDIVSTGAGDSADPAPTGAAGSSASDHLSAGAGSSLGFTA